MSVTLYAEFTARPGRAGEVEALLRGLVARVRAEPGNVRFDAYRVRGDGDRFFVFEEYLDEDAFDAHLAAPYGAPFNAALGPLIVEEGSQLTFLAGAAEPA